MSKVHRVGTILRYSHGETALMQVNTIREGHGGSIARYWGPHCMGGTYGAYHEDCVVATPEDIETWKTKAHWRR